jgi:hypothetical protein
MPDFLHGGDVCRISASEHVEGRPRGGQRMAEVIHQLLNAAPSGKAPPA